MIIKQLSIFLEDKVGRLAELTEILAKNDINMSAFSVADALDYGILRVVVGRPELAAQILKEAGYSVKMTDVVCLAVPHQPGGLYKALHILSENNIAIDYMYAFASNVDSATVVLHSDDVKHLAQVLQDNQMELVKSNKIYQV